MSKKRLKIYAAGAMSGLTLSEMNDWRERVRGLLDKLVELKENPEYEIDFINPAKYYNTETNNHKTEKEAMLWDLNQVKSSDIIIVNLEGLNTSIGTSIEIYEAYKNSIPILAYGKDETYKDTHPWLKECITRVDSNEISLCNYIYDFYMI